MCNTPLITSAGQAVLVSIGVRIVRVHYLQHVAFEGLGSLEHWLSARQAQISASYLFEPHTQLPDCEAFDVLIVLGGPMSVHDTAEYPWLIAERELIAQAIKAGKAVLGICLGAQLIASATGSKIYRNSYKEIGWWPIEFHPAPHGLTLPERLEVFHWHGETFDLPPEAHWLAQSQACAHQGFLLGERVLGLQFHLETTPESATLLVQQCADELQPAPFIQTATEIQAAPAARYQAVNQLMEQLLDYITAHYR